MTDAEKIRALKDEHTGELTPEARLFMELTEARTRIVELENENAELKARIHAADAAIADLLRERRNQE